MREAIVSLQGAKTVTLRTLSMPRNANGKVVKTELHENTAMTRCDCLTQHYCFNEQSGNATKNLFSCSCVTVSTDNDQVTAVVLCKPEDIMSATVSPWDWTSSTAAVALLRIKATESKPPAGVFLVPNGCRLQGYLPAPRCSWIDLLNRALARLAVRVSTSARRSSRLSTISTATPTR